MALDAFANAFGPRDDVELVVKVVPYPPQVVRPDLLGEWRERVAALEERGYSCTVVEAYLSDVQLADLYRSADVLLAPFRGEGFCMPILEAMACGTPPIVTSWSGPEDFAGDAALRIPPDRLEPATPFLAEPEIASPGARMAEPSLEAAVALLRHVRDAPECLAGRGEAATRSAGPFTWACAADVLRTHARRLVDDLVR